MGKWVPWQPHDKIGAKLDLVSFLFDENGIFIRLRDLDTSEDYELKYDSVFSFRNSDEGRRLRLLNTLSEIYGDRFYKEWSIFKVESSDYLKWFHEETYGMYESYDIEHHVYITSNDILEIVTAHAPILTE